MVVYAHSRAPRLPSVVMVAEGRYPSRCPLVFCCVPLAVHCIRRPSVTCACCCFS
ncbi:hypothetical protein BDZ97DRAFT_1822526 [Flammula alnicola]|nr:hypothetical protein BDZ97DRAFT_1822526 [Flammula alnicola]